MRPAKVDKTKKLITASNVEVSFLAGDETVAPLKDVSFNVNESTFNIIYGASGSGKSTLLNVLSGLQQPTKGSVTFKGQDLYDLSPDELARFRSNELGFVYQANYWVKSLTVLENVAMPLYFFGYSRAKSYTMAMEALETVGMQDYAKKYPFLLSGGEQQRVAVARALANDPAFLIADEPTGALDSKNGDFIMGLLQSCNIDGYRTVILVTHNMEYLPYAEKLIHIVDGNVEEMQSGQIRETTHKMMQDLKKRIDSLTEVHANA